MKDETEFQELLNEFVETDEVGKELVSQNTLGFEEGKLIFMKIYSTSVGRQRDPFDIKMPIYEKWEAFIQNY